MLGSRYLAGAGCAQDYGEAVKWLRIAADKGSADAQFNLGLSYHLGNGVAKDPALALDWIKKAARQGHDRAIALLQNKA
jgi:hypothetical protein